MLCGVLTPEWESKSASDFLDLMHGWGSGIAEYERQSKERLSDSVKAAIVLKRAPSDIKQALRMSFGAVRG